MIMLIAYTQVGSARDNMEVYVVEVYDGQETNKTPPNEGQRD